MWADEDPEEENRNEDNDEDSDDEIFIVEDHTTNTRSRGQVERQRLMDNMRS